MLVSQVVRIRMRHNFTPNDFLRRTVATQAPVRDRLAGLGYRAGGLVTKSLWEGSPMVKVRSAVAVFRTVWGNLDLLSWSESPVVRAFPYLVLVLAWLE